MIRVENLIFKYPGKTALDSVTFSIAPGSITALVGPNGAGKTTLLRCIAALDAPFSGTIQVAGIDVAKQPRQVHRSLGYLSDFFGVYNHLTVMQCLVFAGRLHELEGAALTAKINETAEMLGLTPYLANRASTLSRGWRQRLGIAQAIIHRPRLLLLDEPASGLDPEARLGLSSLMRRLQAEGMTLVVSSHVLAELEDYCTEMLVLREGKVMQHLPAAPGAQAQNIVEIGFKGAPEPILALLGGFPQVKKFTCEGQVITAEFEGGEDDQQSLLAKLIQSGILVSSFALKKARLQDVYMSLSKKEES